MPSRDGAAPPQLSDADRPRTPNEIIIGLGGRETRRPSRMLSRYSLPVIKGIVPTGVTCGLEPRSSLRRSGSPSRSSARLIHFEPVEAAEAHQWLVGQRKQLV